MNIVPTGPKKPVVDPNTVDKTTTQNIQTASQTLAKAASEALAGQKSKSDAKLPPGKAKSPAPATPMKKETESHAGGFFATIGAGLSSFVSWIGNKGKGGVEATLEFACIKGDLQKDYAKSLDKLKGITGENDFGLFIPSFSIIITNAIKSKQEKGLKKTLIDDEESTIKEVMRTMLAKILANLGEKLQEKDKGKITTNDILAHFGKLFQERWVKAQEEMAAHDKIDLPSARAIARDKTMTHFFEDFMAIVLPNKAADLPVRWALQSFVWKKLRGNVVPLLVEQSDQTARLQNLSKMDQLKKNASNSNVVKLIQMLGKLSTEWGRGLLADPAITESLAAKFSGALPLEPTKDEALAKKMRAELQTKINFLIKDFGTGLSPHVLMIWQMIERGVEIPFSHVLSTLGDGAIGQEDVLTAGTHQLMQTISAFIKKHKASLEPAFQAYKGEPKDPQKKQAFEDKLKPLAREIQSIGGLDPAATPLPQLAVPGISKFFEGTLPGLIAENYEALLVPIVEVYDAITAPEPFNPALKQQLEATAKGKALAAQCQRLGEIAATHIPGVVAKQKDLIANAVVDNLKNKLADAKKVMDKFVLEGLGVGGGKLEVPADAASTYNQILETVRQVFTEKIETVAANKGPKAQNLWLFVQNRLADIVAKIVIKSPSTENANAAKIVVNRFLDCFGKYVDTHGQALHQRFLLLLAANTPPQNDPEFVKQFLPLCDMMLDDLGKDLPIPALLDTTAKDIIRSELPPLLATHFRESLSPEASIKDSQARLEKLLAPTPGSRPSPSIRTPSRATPKIPPGALVEMQVVVKEREPIGSKTVIALLDHVFNIVSEKITIAVNEKANDQLAKTLNPQNAPVVPPKTKLLKQAAKLPSVTKASAEPVPPPKQLKDSYMQQAIKSLLMQALVNYLEGAEKDGTPIKGASFSVLVSKLANTLDKHLLADAQNIQQAVAVKDADKQRANLRAAFTPLSKDLLELFRSPKGPKEGLPLDLPFASYLKDAWKDIQETIVPDVLAQMYLDTTSWHRLIEANREQITKRAGGKSAIPTACTKLSEWISASLPPFFTSSRESLAQTIYSAASTYLSDSQKPSEKAVAEFLTTHENDLKGALGDIIFSGFNKTSQFGQRVQFFSKEYLEAALLQVFKNLTAGAEALENKDSKKYQEDYLVKLGIRCLNIVNEHFQTINKIATEAGDKPNHEISTETFIKGFEKSNILHRGMPNSEKALEAGKEIKKCLQTLKHHRQLLTTLKDPVKIQKSNAEIKAAQARLRAAKEIDADERMKFFKPFGKTILELADVRGPQDLPFPSPLREEVYDLIKKQLLPKVMGAVFESVMEPTTRSKMLISGLKTLNQALDAEDQIEKQYNTAFENFREANQNFKACIWLANNTKKPHPKKSEILRLLSKASDSLKIVQKITDPLSYSHVLKKYQEYYNTIQTQLKDVDNSLAILISQDKSNQIQPPLDPKIVLFLVEAKDQLAAAQKDLKSILDQITRDQEINAADDDTQRQLNSACGELVLQLVNLIPHSLVKAVLKINKLQMMTSEKVGRIVRKQLADEWNILKIFEESASAAISTLDPKGDSKYSFPETDDELEAAEMAKFLENIKLDNEARALLKKTTHRGVQDSIITTLKYPLSKLKEAWDWFLDKVFRGYAPEVRNWIHWLIYKVIYRFCDFIASKIPSGLTNAVTSMMWDLFDFSIRTTSKIDHFYQNLLIDIHANLLYKLADELRNSGTKNRHEDTMNLVRPLSQAFARRKALEEAEAAKFEQELTEHKAQIQKQSLA